MKRVILILAVVLTAALMFGDGCPVPAATPTDSSTEFVSFNPGPAIAQTDLFFTVLPQIAVNLPSTWDYGELCIEHPEEFNDQAFYINIKKNCPITIDAVVSFWVYKDDNWQALPYVSPSQSATEITEIPDISQYFGLLLIGRESHIWTGTQWIDGTFYPMTESLPYWYGLNCYDTFYFKLNFSYSYVACRDWCLNFIAANYKATVLFTITGELDP